MIAGMKKRLLNVKRRTDVSSIVVDRAFEPSLQLQPAKPIRIQIFNYSSEYFHSFSKKLPLEQTQAE